MQQDDVIWHHQFASGLVPSGAVADQQGNGACRYLGADLGQMQVHHLGIGIGRDDGCASAACRADSTKDVGGLMPVITHHQRARADRRPDIGVAALLADPRFVLKPYLYRRAGRYVFERRAR